MSHLSLIKGVGHITQENIWIVILFLSPNIDKVFDIRAKI